MACDGHDRVNGRGGGTFSELTQSLFAACRGPRLVTVGSGVQLSFAMQLMLWEGVRHLPVVDDGSLPTAG